MNANKVWNNYNNVVRQDSLKTMYCYTNVNDEKIKETSIIPLVAIQGKLITGNYILW